MEDVIKKFLELEDGSGDGSGYGSGYGDGYGDGDGSGYGAGYGDGYSYGYGAGYGDGSGDGSGYGAGYGSGSGDGSGSGSGSGDGSGYGYGSGKDIKEIDGLTVYQIDDQPTVIVHVHGNVAKGAIVQGDLTMLPCFIVKGSNCFAHGETLHAAREALLEKMFDDMPAEERVAAFVKDHKAGHRYSNQDFFDWHHRLTGSCEMGRQQFVKEHGIDMAGCMTPEDFVRLTMNDYGRDIIRMLKPYYGIE